MSKTESKEVYFENTYKGICATPILGIYYCGWKTASLIDEKTVTNNLQEHFDSEHPGNSAAMGYVHSTSIINKLKL